MDLRRAWIVVVALTLVSVVEVVWIVAPVFPLEFVQDSMTERLQYLSSTASSDLESEPMAIIEHNIQGHSANVSAYQGANLSPSAAITPSVNFAYGDSPDSRLENCDRKMLTAGYVLALRDWEQQTAGSANLMSLQCWAATLNMVVVESFIPRSLFGVPHELLVNASTANPEDFSRIGDVFDLNYWNEYSRSNCYAPLVRWEVFVNSAPREVILVYMKYIHHDWNIVKSCPPQDEYGENFLKVLSPFLEAHRFKVVHEVCLETERPWSTRSLNSFILGNRTENVTLIINVWGGVQFDTQRLNVSDTKCNRLSYFHLSFAKPSTKVLEDVRVYREQILKNKDYIAIMVRLQFALIGIQNSNWSISNCLKGVSSVLKRFKLIENIDETFWSLDVGESGSIEYEQQETLHIFADKALTFMKEYHNVTYTDEEEDLRVISGTSNEGYIAYLQKNIAARAKCLLTFGGGTFQAHARNLYGSLHKGTPCTVMKSTDWLIDQCSHYRDN